MPQRFCTHCGSELKKGHKFCTRCGATINSILKDNGDYSSLDRKEREKLLSKTKLFLTTLSLIISLASVVLCFIKGAYIDWVDDEQMVSLFKGALLAPIIFIIVAAVFLIFVFNLVIFIFKLRKIDKPKISILLSLLAAALSFEYGLTSFLKLYHHYYHSLMIVFGVLGFVDMALFLSMFFLLIPDIKVKQNKKRISLSLSFASVFALSFACFSPVIFSNESMYVNGDFQFYSITADTYAVCGYRGSKSSITIPSKYSGKPVVKILLYRGGFRYITEMIIPDSVEIIGDSAFRYCERLTSVSIGKNVAQIEDGAFSYCLMLEQINLPEKLSSIGRDAFSHCESLKTISIPDSVTFLGDMAFYYSSLEEVFIGNGINEIAGYAFSGCDNLKSVSKYGGKAADGLFVMPKNVSHIDRNSGFISTNFDKVVVHNEAIFTSDNIFKDHKKQDVFFEGSAEEWEWNSFFDSDDVFYFYSENEPTSEGNYWHYDENELPIVW